ncbi:hypothetical protein BCV69DRAFT_279590 [Microstroma glucosiphilum]|uniref:PUB domain-containing protein n=1 Tax=Pseudomicrostroma glucosiphilum TaxID=1684307 RepID=A0A316UEL4_9BASI|nr:hypothetical protein BCV69DRAFT_279590 [Pseudomicrostroma glucosiphilum]PWN23660.1 hypothetical protein BCV69DRAFT_279590 [Pseudomicrostroma glucosiphilum]
MSHSPSSPPATAATAASPPPSAREAIAAAAQARLASARHGGTGSEAEAQRAKDEADHLLLCRRIVDLQIRRDNGYDKAFECLKTLDTLLSNILSHPTEEKYRSFKSENPRLQRSVLSVPGGTDYLLQAGFGTRTVEFKQQWYLHSSVQPPSTSSEASPASASASPSTSTSTSTVSSGNAQKWRRLQLAHRVLQERLGESEERAVQKREQARREAEVEKNRAARVLQEAQEDRERVALRAQRERLARARGQEEPRGGGAGVGPSAVTGSRSGAVYQQPPPGNRPEYRVNTSTLVGAGNQHNAGSSSDEPGAGIDRSDYTAEVPFDEPSSRGEEAELDDEDEQGDKPPPYGREEWGSGRRLGS